jgi:hypothetical protein
VHMQSEHLELYALGELPKGLSGVVESHLKTCVPCGVQFEQSRAAIGEWTDTGLEQRKQSRVPTDDPAVLTVLKPERSPRLKMKILDSSQHGLKLLVPHELMTGALVQLYVRDRFIMAEVRYCRPEGNAFHVGVLIQDVFPAAG